MRIVKPGDRIEAGEQVGIEVATPTEPVEASHAFVTPNPDYCAVCGMDREAHTEAEVEKVGRIVYKAVRLEVSANEAAREILVALREAP